MITPGLALAYKVMLMDSHMCEKIHHLIKEKTNKVDGEVNKCPVAGVNGIRELLYFCESPERSM